MKQNIKKYWLMIWELAFSDFRLRETAKVGKLYREGRFGGVPYLEKLGKNINK